MFASIIASIGSLAGCSKGIEKPHEFQVKEFVQVKKEDGSTVNAAHCKKKLSVFNYYIVIPAHEMPASSSAGETAAKDYSILVAIEGEEKEEFTLFPDGSTVTDHGYKFSSWKETEK